MKGSISSFRNRIADKLRQAVREQHSPEDTGFSVAFATFITVLPTLGSGLVVLTLASRLSDRLNTLAMAVPVLVFNPVIKYPVYLISYRLGEILMYSELPDQTLEASIQMQAGTTIHTLLIGNLILAVVFSIVAYFLTVRLARNELDLQSILLERSDI